jgi:hypothetical protein
MDRTKFNIISFHRIKGTVSQIFLLHFFHGSSSPKPLKITLGPFQVFSKIRGGIRNSRCITSSNDTTVVPFSRRFSLTTGVNATSGKECILSCKYLRAFLKKFETAQMAYSGAWGKLIHEKNLKRKISWHCPFKSSARDF